MRMKFTSFSNKLRWRAEVHWDWGADKRNGKYLIMILIPTATTKSPDFIKAQRSVELIKIIAKRSKLTKWKHVCCNGKFSYTRLIYKTTRIAAPHGTTETWPWPNIKEARTIVCPQKATCMPWYRQADSRNQNWPSIDQESWKGSKRLRNTYKSRKETVVESRLIRTEK